MKGLEAVSIDPNIFEKRIAKKTQAFHEWEHEQPKDRYWRSASRQEITEAADGTKIALLNIFTYRVLPDDAQLISLTGERKLKRDLIPADLTALNQKISWGVSRVSPTDDNRDSDFWKACHGEIIPEIEWDGPRYVSFHIEEDGKDYEEEDAFEFNFEWKAIPMAERFEEAAAWLRDMAKKHGNRVIISGYSDN